MTTKCLAAIQSQMPTAGVGGTFDGAEQLMQQFSSFGQQQQQQQQLPQQQSNLNLLSGLPSQLGSIPTSVVPGSVPSQMGNLGGFGVSGFGTGQQGQNSMVFDIWQEKATLPSFYYIIPDYKEHLHNG